LPVLTNLCFACIYVIVGFKSFIELMLFVKCIYVPTLNKIYLTLLYFTFHQNIDFKYFILHLIDIIHSFIFIPILFVCDHGYIVLNVFGDYHTHCMLKCNKKKGVKYL